MHVERAQKCGILRGSLIGKRLIFIRPLAQHGDRGGATLFIVVWQMLIEQFDGHRVERYSASLGLLAQPTRKFARK